jgi:ABC-type nitrate/sulfonate/bicarbonate transport system permease component
MSDAAIVSGAKSARAVAKRGNGMWIGVLCLVLLWELAGRALTDAFVLAAPSEVLAYLWEDRGLITRALGVTLGNAAVGYVAGNLAAIALAAVALIWPRSERIVTGLALLVFCLPLVATGPILRVLFGPGPGPQITLAALAVYYTTLIPLLVGLRAAPAGWFDLVRSYGRGRWSELLHVRLMASLPYLFAGLQIAAPAAFLGAMVGEFTGAERGLGVLTVRAIRALDVEMTWGVATVATAVAILAYAALGTMARRVLKDAPPVILAALPGDGRSALTGWQVALNVTAIALVAWAGAIWLFGLNPFFAKGPWDVFAALLLDDDAGATRATLGTALSETAVYLVPGYVAGLAAGAGLAMLLVLFPVIASTAMPVAIALRSVPIVTTAPLVVLLLGRGAAGTIALVAVMVFFPTFVACLHGLRQAPGQVLDLFDSFAAGPVSRLLRVQIPAMLPAFFAAARMAVPASVLAVTVVEWLATGAGIGSLMALSASLSDFDMLWSSVVLVAAISAAGYALVGAVERRVLQVYAPEQLA